MLTLKLQIESILKELVEYKSLKRQENLPQCLFIQFSNAQDAEKFGLKHEKIQLSDECKATVLRRPYNSLPPGAESVVLDGLSDIGDSPTSLLLLRNLASCITEKRLYSLIADLDLEPTRIFLIRRKDIFGLPSGLAFAEFKSHGLAGQAMRKLNSLSKAPSTTTKSIQGLSVSYVSLGAFEIAKYPFDYTFTSSGGVVLQYAHPDYRISEFPNRSEKDSLEKQEEKATINAITPEPITKLSSPPILNPLLSSNPIGLAGNSLGSRKRRSQSSNPSDINHKLKMWKKPKLDTEPTKIVSSSVKVTEKVQKDIFITKSYADRDRLNCYLCFRHFETPEKLNNHERMSLLHQKNLADTNVLERAEKIHAGLLKITTETTKTTQVTIKCATAPMKNGLN